MLNVFLPDMYKKDIFDIDYKKLKEEDIKCILFDLDNTISPAKEVIYKDDVKDLFEKLKKDFKIIIFSNNFPKRVSKFAKYYDVDYACLSLKPLLYKYIYIKLKYNLKSKDLVSIGDQIVTDIFGGNKSGIYTILVDPVSAEDEMGTYINRKVESLILNKFKKNNKFIKGKYYD